MKTSRPLLLLLVLIIAVGCSALSTNDNPPETATSGVSVPPTEPAPTATPPETSTPPPALDVLRGTEWLLVSLGSPGAEAPVVEGATVTLQFTAEGQAGGSAGCNGYSGAYQVEGVNLTFGPIASTLMACADEATTAQESSYLAALQAATRFEVHDEQLTIWYDEGQAVLNFVTAKAGSSATETPEPEEALQIRKLQMLDAQGGWAVGHLVNETADRILFSADGGATWTERTPPEVPTPGPGPFSEIRAAAFFSSTLRGWATYTEPAPQSGGHSPRVWSTVDGGESWQAGSDLDLSGLPFEFYLPSDLGFRGQFGWLLAHLGVGMSHDYIAIFTSADGGESWQRVADPDTVPHIQGCQKSALLFIGEEDGWLAGNCPGLMPSIFLYRSSDGGATWSQAVLPLPEGLAGASEGHLGDSCGIPQLVALPSRTLLLSLRCVDFGQDSSQYKTQSWLYRSEDGGQSWLSQQLPLSPATFAFINPDEGWLLGSAPGQGEGEQTLSQTVDAGQSWRSLATLALTGEPDLIFAGARTGWIISGAPAARILLRSEDGGSSWNELLPILR